MGRETNLSWARRWLHVRSFRALRLQQLRSEHLIVRPLLLAKSRSLPACTKMASFHPGLFQKLQEDNMMSDKETCLFVSE
jgi:hypothetical protein